MQFVSIKELSRSPSRYIKLAAQGDSVIVTRHGKPAAVITEMNEADLEDFILASHLNLEDQFRQAASERARGETATAEELLEELDRNA